MVWMIPAKLNKNEQNTKMSGILNFRAKKLEYNKTSFEKGPIAFNKDEIPNNFNDFRIDLRIGEQTNEPLDRQNRNFNSFGLEEVEQPTILFLEQVSQNVHINNQVLHSGKVINRENDFNQMSKYPECLFIREMVM